MCSFINHVTRGSYLSRAECSKYQGHPSIHLLTLTELYPLAGETYRNKQPYLPNSLPDVLREKWRTRTEPTQTQWGRANLQRIWNGTFLLSCDSIIHYATWTWHQLKQMQLSQPVKKKSKGIAAFWPAPFLTSTNSYEGPGKLTLTPPPSAFKAR